MVGVDSRNRKVLQRYLTSQDINQSVKSEPTRYSINFDDMSKQEAAKFAAPYSRVVKLVKPNRDKLTRQIHESCFWKHWDRREAFYEKLRKLPRAIVGGRVSKHHAFTFARTEWLISDGVVIFLRNDFTFFALMQSTIHAEWVQRYKTTMRLDTNYSVGRCFLTFPRPTGPALLAQLEDVGKRYFDHRTGIAKRLGVGLTSIYNRFHDRNDSIPEIVRLRELRKEMDCDVLAAYGWDTRLEHGFHETKQGVRFSISQAARSEVLRALLQLNHQRAKSQPEGGACGDQSDEGSVDTGDSVRESRQGRLFSR
jgi:hypothetical protein